LELQTIGSNSKLLSSRWVKQRLRRSLWRSEILCGVYTRWTNGRPICWNNMRMLLARNGHFYKI